MKKLILSGDVGYEISVQKIRNFLDEAKGADIEVHLASPGGYIFDGIEIYNLFRDYKRNNPNAQMMLIIKGEAASMASYIAVNPAWDLVAAEDNAVLMIHNAWGGVVGDYREVAKMAEILDGLTNLIGKAYSAKIKKPLPEIRVLMDEESWFFGEELFEAGFVDEIIKTENPKDKDSAIIEAKTKFQVMSKKLSNYEMNDIQKIAATIRTEPQNPYPNEHSARIRDPKDFEKDSFRRKNIEDGIDIIIGKLKGKTTTTTQAYRFKKDKWTVAEAKKWLKDHDIKYISFEPAENSDASTTPAERENNIQEDTSMTLEEFLSQNPSAQIELNKIKEKEFEAGAKSVQDRIESALPFLQPESAYPGPIKKLALDVINGKVDTASLKASVATYDSLKEKEKSDIAVEESAKLAEIKGQQIPQVSTNGIINNEIDVQAVVAAHKGKEVA